MKGAIIIKKGFISIELIIVAVIVMIVGFIALRLQAQQADGVLDDYESRIDKELENTAGD